MTRAVLLLRGPHTRQRRNIKRLWARMQVVIFSFESSWLAAAAANTFLTCAYPISANLGSVCIWNFWHAKKLNRFCFLRARKICSLCSMREMGWGLSDERKSLCLFYSLNVAPLARANLYLSLSCAEAQGGRSSRGNQRFAPNGIKVSLCFLLRCVLTL